MRRELRLVRNPRFRLWSRDRDARPDGFADQIVIRFRDESRFADEVRTVQRQDADLAEVSGPFGSPPVDLDAIRSESAPQLHTDAAAELDAMVANTAVPPFDDVRVRQALNYATDRRRAVQLAGGSDIAEPACQLLPVSFPGYEPPCRYTRNPGRAGGWIAPDMATARRLIAESGTKGARVTVIGYAQKREITLYFVSLLRRLGYRTRLRMYPDYGPYAPIVEQPGRRAQIGINGWTADTAGPSTFVAPFVCANGADDTRFCDRGIQARIERATTARGTDAQARWRDVLKRLSDAAVAVPLINRRALMIVSKRVGNYQHHLLYGTLYDQLWVR